jgi:parallel beta-helix repeat protein
LGGTYIILKTIIVNKLVTIQPDGGVKVVLKAKGGIPIFDVVAQGGPGKHVLISGLYVGGGGNGPKDSAEAAFRLLNDNFTEIANNIIGAEDLPINNGIVLNNSDHSNIHDNVIQGNSGFTFTPTLTVGKNLTGFGIVTFECFGTPGPGVSDSVTINNNLFTNLWLAGIWLCSDGAGEHQITNNTFRNNWRGIALKDVTNSKVDANVLTDDKSDGIVVYGASLRNVISNHRVESHVAPDAAGIRVGWIADPIVPLDNRLDGNRLARDTVAVHIFGARTTQLHNNEIKISGARTAILITPSTFPLDPGTQPRDTEITGNIIVFTGPCAQVIGCGIRLVGTTVPVLATDNDWGLRQVADVEGVIYHKLDDPVLGLVTFTPFRNQANTTPVATSTPAMGGTPPGGSTSTPAMPVQSTPTSTSTPSSNGGPVVSVALTAGCQLIKWPGASGISVVDAVQGISPLSSQRTVTIWHQQPGGGWQAWGPGVDRRAPSDIFSINHDDPLEVCVDQSGSWLIPTQIGGP